jgi:hypothetical protein
MVRRRARTRRGPDGGGRLWAPDDHHPDDDDADDDHADDADRD